MTRDTPIPDSDAPLDPQASDSENASRSFVPSPWAGVQSLGDEDVDMLSADHLERTDMDSAYSEPSMLESNHTLSFSELGARFEPQTAHTHGAGSIYLSPSASHTRSLSSESGGTGSTSTSAASSRSEGWTEDEVSMAAIRLERKNKNPKERAPVIRELCRRKGVSGEGTRKELWQRLLEIVRAIRFCYVQVRISG